MIELEDFICRCGARDFIVDREQSAPYRMGCRACRREYRVRKLEKKASLNNLPMSFGFRSLYWDKIEINPQGITGICEEGYEISEING